MVVLILFGLVAGCSGMTAGLSRDQRQPPDAAAQAEARALLAVIGSRNTGLNNFKGRGAIKVWQKGQLKFKEKIFWIGSGTDKVRVVLTLGGYPAVKMASDGKWFYYYEVAAGDPIYKKIAASNANLKRILSISIHTDDVLSLLAGRVPIREYNSALLEPAETGPGYVLILKKRWWGIRQKIYLDPSKRHVRQVEFYSRSGSLIYRARFDEMQPVKEYLVPARLNITNGSDANFELDIKDFWADVAVEPSMFVLNPPK
ncbi:hypothetical protein D1AOALGA4SA_578 [Olavius algarvensis Delta 1 endosymbiont]|nr:hypothetical protein D1AOALGA4SA_578 [Olavius algarvensis Delta 1 endosymbiont]